MDRGAHSLETICLLLALKIEHPHAVHLIRGNHEAADINALFGCGAPAALLPAPALAAAHRRMPACVKAGRLSLLRASGAAGADVPPCRCTPARFRLECLERLGDAAGLKTWQRLNTLFNWLPLAALIEDKVGRLAKRWIGGWALLRGAASVVWTAGRGRGRQRAAAGTSVLQGLA